MLEVVDTPAELPVVVAVGTGEAGAGPGSVTTAGVGLAVTGTVGVEMGAAGVGFDSVTAVFDPGIVPAGAEIELGGTVNTGAVIAGGGGGGGIFVASLVYSAPCDPMGMQEYPAGVGNSVSQGIGFTTWHPAVLHTAPISEAA